MGLCPVLTPGDPVLERWLDRGPSSDSAVVQRVAELLDDVRERGAEAVRDAARRFDAPGLEGLFVSAAEFEAVSLPHGEAEAIQTSIRRVTEFHEVQLSTLTADWEEVDGGWAWRTAAVEDSDAEEGDAGWIGQRMIPLSRVGVYVPGGKASYPSSVVMNAVPAGVAGVKEIVLATPPLADGTVAPAVLFAARELGITTVLKCGGAAAIGAFAWGIAGLGRVDKIVGPGSVYVNEAKRQVWGRVGLDGYAGPSEVCVVAFSDSPPDRAAVDWLTQIEHSEDNVGVLVTTSRAVAEQVMEAAEEILRGQAREASMRRALADHGVVVVCESEDEVFAFVNRLAPEHLTLLTEHADRWVPGVVNAGCIVLGLETPQSAGDFVSGPSHTLPTSGAARFAGPVNVLDFLKLQSISDFSRADLRALAPTIQAFGEMEGFPVHARGASIRLEN